MAEIEFDKFDIFNETMFAADFTSQATLDSVEQKLVEIGNQIGIERGTGGIDLFIDAENRTRAQQIPFRGNPTDVKFLEVDNVPEAFVPLGGGISDPGHEVAIVNLNNNDVERVKVGIHPQRLFAHEPSGLVFVCNQFSNYISIDYHTDNNEADAFFNNVQKQLAGSIPWDIERTVQGDRVFVVMFGNDLVQELNIGNGEFRLQAQGGLIFPTAELPTAVALDEDGNRLLVASMGGEVLEVFDLDNAQLQASINLGYAQPRYPATVMEAGEYFFATAKWSNDDRKACTSCHIDRLLTDGVGFANGSTAPSVSHQVKPIYNLMETDMFFWNGSFQNNSNASLAFAASRAPTASSSCSPGSRVSIRIRLFVSATWPTSPGAPTT